MAVTLDRIVRNVPDSGDIYGSPCSASCIDSADAMSFANNAGGYLQSVGEAVVFRYFDYPDSFDIQKTRTLNLVFRMGKKYFSAFVETPNDMMGMGLYRAGVSMNNKQKFFVCSADELFFLDLLRKAKNAHRIVPLSKESHLLWTEQKKGHSSYGRSSHAVALFGHPEIAELNACILYNKGDENGVINELGIDCAVDILGGSSKMAVFPVSLGGREDGCKEVNWAGLHVLYETYCNFAHRGRARAVSKVSFS